MTSVAAWASLEVVATAAVLVDSMAVVEDTEQAAAIEEAMAAMEMAIEDIQSPVVGVSA